MVEEPLAGRFDAAGERALCLCRGGVIDAAVRVTSPLAVNIGESLQVNDLFAVQGDLEVTGTLNVMTSLEVGGELHVGGNVAASGADVRVGGSAQVAGALAAATLTVGGELTMSAGEVFEVAQGFSGEPLRAAVGLPLSCNCDSLTDESLASVPEDRGAVTLESTETGTVVSVCGRGRLEPGRLQGDVRIVGAGVLLIEGATQIGGDLVLRGDPAGTLYVAMTDSLAVFGELRTAADTGPVRLYIAGPDNLQLDMDSDFTGTLVMPTAELLVTAPLSVNGSAVLGRLNAGASVIFGAEP